MNLSIEATKLRINLQSSLFLLLKKSRVGIATNYFPDSCSLPISLVVNIGKEFVITIKVLVINLRGLMEAVEILVMDWCGISGNDCHTKNC